MKSAEPGGFIFQVFHLNKLDSGLTWEQRLILNTQKNSSMLFH